MDIFDDLEAEEDRLEVVLNALDTPGWLTASAAVGWTITDVVLHLALTEEAVVLSASGASGSAAIWSREPGTLDEVMDRWVRAESAGPELVFQRWQRARRATLTTLRQADPKRPVPWAAAPLKPKALATTRLAEHWAHGLDITEPLGVPFPDTARLRHIAWLAHRSLPYAFSLIGEQPHDVFCELVSPDGAIWRYGPSEAASTISGPAGAFCRVGARRLPPDKSGLVAHGPHGAAALHALRNYAA
jgi:uncharacterized protein (TIGR03084 family)